MTGSQLPVSIDYQAALAPQLQLTKRQPWIEKAACPFSGKEEKGRMNDLIAGVTFVPGRWCGSHRTDYRSCWASSAEISYSAEQQHPRYPRPET